MSVYYGGCPIVVEKNNCGLAAIVTLRALGENGGADLAGQLVVHPCYRAFLPGLGLFEPARGCPHPEYSAGFGMMRSAHFGNACLSRASQPRDALPLKPHERMFKSGAFFALYFFGGHQLNMLPLLAKGAEQTKARA